MNSEDAAALEQAKRLALLHAQTHTKSNFITCSSLHGNLILPVIPYHLIIATAETTEAPAATTYVARPPNLTSTADLE